MPLEASQVEYYAPGDIPKEWEKYLVSNTIYDSEGRWEILLHRSDSLDPIMSQLKINSVKRNLLRSYKTINEVKVILSENQNSTPKMRLTSYLPLGTVRTGDVFIDGNSFDLYDSETQAVWTNESVFAEGRLLQKRTSTKGTLYDIRAVFSEDPEHIVQDKPVYLFRWTYVDPEGKKYVANRWHRRDQSKQAARKK